MLHLHRLDEGEALAAGDPVAGGDQHGDELAVHRRLDGAVPVVEVASLALRVQLLTRFSRLLRLRRYQRLVLGISLSPREPFDRARCS